MTSKQSSWTTHALGDMCDICRGSSPRPIADQRYFVDGILESNECKFCRHFEGQGSLYYQDFQ